VRFTIGDFATFAPVSVKALRHWERVGVLAPARVDRHTGYRYDRADQVVTVHHIAALQMLGFTLAQIRPMLDTPPAGDELAALLHERRATAEQERQRIDQLLASIGARLHLLEGTPTMSADYEILDKTAPAVRVAAVAERIAPDLDDPGGLHVAFGRLFTELMQRLTAAKIRPIGAAWSLYDRSGEHGLTIHAALPIAADAAAAGAELLVVERPQLRAAATVHTGPLDYLASAYAAVMQRIEARGLVPAGGAAEISLVWYPEQPNATPPSSSCRSRHRRGADGAHLA
jgi:DNA-binding transcriptional MerR regulator/effector-binding domain-containing protein